MSSKTKKQKSLEPKLRFFAFRDADGWQQSTIGELGSFYYGKSAPKWSLSADAPTPCVRYGELYTKFRTIISEVISRTNIDPATLKFSKGGEILIPRVGEKAEDFANCCYLPFPDIAIGEMISVYETKEYPIFYTYYFRTLRKQFARVVEGQNVKNLYYVNLEPIPVCKPTIPEQKKIADCLSSLDELIEAEDAKLEALQQHKKGLMQELGKGEIPLYGTGGYMLSVDDYLYDGESVCIGRKGTIDKPVLLTGKFWTVDTLFYTHSFQDSIPKFIFLIFQTIQWKKHNEAGGVPSLNKANIEKIMVAVPKITEQQRIAAFFSSIDNLITAQSQKLEALYDHKKGLMQQLFPNIGGEDASI